jgi:acetyl-CoA acetyltransferase family protein
MGETAENVAERYRVSREDQDAFALRSHQRAVTAQQEGRFAEQLVAVEAPSPNGRDTRLVDADEGPRADTSLEKLASLRPAFREGGTVTAGNASTLNDGAACVVVASERRADELGAEPLAQVVASGVAGVDPAYMGIGPIPAIRRALEAAGLKLDQVDLIEINEAFAAQVLACARALGIDEGRLNVNGGAIALGHPLGCSGARLVTTLAWELRRRGARYGVAALCVGVGQGVATVIENPSAR